jgi:MFS family permease
MKLDVKKTILMGFGFMSAMIAWTFYNFKIPIILNGIMGAEEGSWARVGLLGTEPYMEVVGGFLMTLDNILAILLQPYFGALSDRMESKYGRRTPFFLIGLPIAVFCLFIMPFCGIIGLFIGVILVFNMAMAFYRPPVMSVMPDKTPPQVLSSANSFIAGMGGIGFVFGMLIPAIVGLIPGAQPTVTGNLATQDYFWQDFWGFFLTGLFMLICLVVFITNVKEVPTGDKFWHIGDRPIEVDVYTQKVLSPKAGEMQKEPTRPGFFDDWKDIRKDEDKSSLWVLLAVFSYLFGFNALEFSFGRYATSYLLIAEGVASLLLAIMPVMLIVFAIPAGKLAEKHGRLKIMKVGLIIMAVCTVGLILYMPVVRAIAIERSLKIPDLVPVIILLSIAGIGYGFTHINALPVVWQLSPKNKIGAYTGVYYMVSALGAIISPIFMSSLYWAIRAGGGNQWLALFPYYLFGVLVGFFFITKAKRGDAVPLSKEELNAIYAQYMMGD